MRHHILIALLFLTISSIALGSPEDFRGIVNSGTNEFVAAIKAKDAARVGALYAADAVIFPPNSERIQGREAIQNFWKGLIDGGMTAEIETVEAEGDSSLGMDTGTYKIITADGKTADHGKYVVVWKKEGGAWKLYRDIWNSSVPAAAPPAQ